MQISHLGHAAVLIETEGARVLIDPGAFSDAWHGVTDLDAIVITHSHHDHLDPRHLPGLVQVNPAARVLVEPSVAQRMSAGDLPDVGATAFGEGEQTAFGDLLVTAVGSQHAVIHRDVPRIGNVGLVVASEGQPTLFHPGDSLETVPNGVDVLAMPAYAPWAAVKETIDFVRAVGALETFPIHDELLSDRGRALITKLVGEQTDTRLIDLRGGTPRDF